MPETVAPAKDASLRKIEKAQVEWSSTKSQMFFGGMLIVLSVFIAYNGTLSMGFLLDDYLHLDYAARVLKGDVAPFLNNFISNWGGSDIMKSYRPVISLSMFIDYVLFHIHAFGYHFTNIAVFSFCAVFVALITLEICGRLNARGGALSAIWAGLLFSVYPLHAESVAWVIGRVDTVATAFYLASCFCFLRWQLLKEKGYIVLSLVSFLLAMMSKEIAVSLPLAIFLLALLPPPQGAGASASKRNSLKSVTLAVAPYAATLIIFAIFRHCLLGTTVGGYGGAGVGNIFSSLRIFADQYSLTKIFVPISEEYQSTRSLALACLVPVIVAAAAYVVRQLLLFTNNRFRFALFAAPLMALFWAAAALIPAFQIWHIYPNLVGSRLFFLSSAGLCIGLALLALPSAELISKRIFSALAIIPVAALACLYFVWSYCLQVNLAPWLAASARMSSFNQQVNDAIAATPAAEGPILILNLPQDYKGAGMIGRKLYLDILNRPPFRGDNQADRLLTIEPLVSGNRDFVWPDQLRAAAKEAHGNVYIWSNDSVKLTRLKVPDVAGEADDVNSGNALKEKLRGNFAVQGAGRKSEWRTISPRDLEVTELSDGYWQISKAFERDDTGKIKKSNISSVVEIPLPVVIRPDQAKNLILSLQVDDSSYGITRKVLLLWSDVDRKEVVPTAAIDETMPFIDQNSHPSKFLFYPGRKRSFVFADKPLRLSLLFDLGEGPIKFKPDSLTLMGDSKLLPVLKISGEKDAQNNFTTPPQISWDVTKAAATGTFSELNFLLTERNNTIDPNSEFDFFRPEKLDKAKLLLSLPLNTAKEKNLNEKGTLPLETLLKAARQELPDLQNCDKKAYSTNSTGLRQLVIMLANKDGKLASMPSAPITLDVSK